jgi:hypothetical protein
MGKLVNMQGRDPEQRMLTGKSVKLPPWVVIDHTQLTGNLQICMTALALSLTCVALVDSDKATFCQ